MSFGTKLENKSAPAGFFYLYKWQQMLLNKKVEGQISAASVGKASGRGFFHVERIPKIIFKSSFLQSAQTGD
jgi:hypothetical protein